jgi:enamine deaminase RidA (YjgF/YER057c/UK114 family)
MGKNQEVVVPEWATRYGRLTYGAGVIRAGGRLLFISGQGPIDDTGRLLAPGDLKEQTRIIYERIGKVLEAAGGSFDDIVKTTDYIVPEAVATYKETGEIRRQYLKGTARAATGVIVHSLLKKGMLIEIDAIAVLD